MTDAERIEILKKAVAHARVFGAMDALRGVIALQSQISLEFEQSGTAAEFRAAERVISEAQHMLESIASASGV